MCGQHLSQKLLPLHREKKTIHPTLVQGQAFEDKT
jgi:hypothetical protein